MIYNDVSLEEVDKRKNAVRPVASDANWMICGTGGVDISLLNSEIYLKKCVTEIIQAIADIWKI